jgi:hypothetical protein
MTSKAVARLPRPLSRARRRLFVQELLDGFVRWWAGALALAAAWFLVQPFFTGAVDDSLRWGIAAGVFGLATVAAVVRTCRRSPGPLDVALAVDERFGLAERVTTSLSLSEAEAASPAGQALLADVDKRLAPLDVRSRFPVRLSRSAALVPAAAVALALVALFYDPHFGSASDGAGKDNERSLAAARDLEQKVKELKKRSLKDRPSDADKSKELKELEDAWKRLLEQKLDANDKEKVREQAQALRTLEEKMKDRMQDVRAQLDKNKAVLKQLQQLQKTGPDGKKAEPKDGPAKDVEEALAKGKLDQAQEALEKLHKKLAEEKLDKKELKQLEEQLKDMKDRLQRLGDQQDKKDELQRQKDQGKLTDEQMKEAQEELEREAQDLQDLKDLAEMLKDVQDDLKNGKKGEAAGKLKKMAGRLKKMELGEEEMRELEKNGQEAAELREAMLQRLNDGRPGDQQGDQKGNQQGNPNGNALDRVGSPGGKRPTGKDRETGSKTERQPGELDPRGGLRVSGFSKGGTFTKVPAKEIQGTFRRAEQEAPEAIERQRVSPEEAEMLKGYYENLGGQKK